MTFITVQKQLWLSILTSFHGTLCASLFPRFTSLSLPNNSSSFILIRFIHWKKPFCCSSHFAWLIYFHFTSTVINTFSSSERNRNKTSSFFLSFFFSLTNANLSHRGEKCIQNEMKGYVFHANDYLCSYMKVSYFFLSFSSSSFLTSGTHSWIYRLSLFSFFLSFLLSTTLFLTY